MNTVSLVSAIVSFTSALVTVLLGAVFESGRLRLVNMHNALLDLIDFLDPKVVWVIGPRDRLPLPYS